jgi:hypothetical protein
MVRNWTKRVFADLATDRKKEPKVPSRPLAEARKTIGIRNHTQAVNYASYASVAAGAMKRNDDEEISALTPLLPATPERHTNQVLAKQARKPKVDRRLKKQRTDQTPAKIKLSKAKILPLCMKRGAAAAPQARNAKQVAALAM